jgi:2-polyprenyl-3-methyl-5-hydroxy-6-metoxy-1,4-benzoquinol methylase
MLLNRLIEQNIIESFNSAIDIGCNSGAYAKIISDHGFRYVLGIDIDGKKIRMANDFFAFNENDKTIKFEVTDAEEIDTQKKYDLVLCSEVIEHTNNPKKVIKNIEAILAPRGVAIITMPNAISLPYILTLVYYKVLKTEMPDDIRQHLDYPFYRVLNLFRGTKLRIVGMSGSNLIFFRYTVRFLYTKKAFPIINKMDFRLSKMWPLKYFAQSFIVILKKE